MTTPTEVRVLARAKVNLYLGVLGTRPDGYHEIETLMQSVDLADSLTMRRATRTTVRFEWEAPLTGPAPARPDLVEQAAGLLARSCRAGEVEVAVRKSVPMSAGLAGGSADAAAALLGMEALFPGKVTRQALGEAARRLGSDVPFALQGGTCLATGRGEKVGPVKCPEPAWWVLGMSLGGIRTEAVYRRFDEIGPAPGERSLAGLVSALASGDLGGAGALLSNDLEDAALDPRPPLPSRMQAMRSTGALGVVMSGSGPTIAGLFEGRAPAEAAAGKVSGIFDLVRVCRSAPVGAEVAHI